VSATEQPLSSSATSTNTPCDRPVSTTTANRVTAVAATTSPTVRTTPRRVTANQPPTGANNSGIHHRGQPNQLPAQAHDHDHHREGERHQRQASSQPAAHVNPPACLYRHPGTHRHSVPRPQSPRYP
jgi:hypothetical protein